MSRSADLLAAAIREEVGKPTGEAMAEGVAEPDGVRWTVSRASGAGEWLGSGSWREFG